MPFPLPLLALEFPPTSDEWTFFVAAAVILLGPLLVERIGLPGVVGVILGGLLVGPFVLGWVERDGIVESLGDLGILVLMFLAGLELDLDEFQANRRGALTFGAFTFTLPFVLGIGVAAGFGYGAATALLFGSLWASHTLVAYPIIREHGLLRDRSIGIAGGGTVMTDTLALSVLAVVAGSVASDSAPAVLLLEVIIGLAALALVCAFVLPWVTRWFFAGVGQYRGARFLWILVALTGAAVVAEEAGIEGIVGAFFAGLALNRLVPARSRLMEQVEFIGGVLLIPFFLLSTGMLIDPEKFTEKRVLGIAALSLTVVVVGKAAAAFLSSRVLHLSRPQGQVLFGLSLAQAAATLAAVTIGVDIGLFDTDLLNATLVVVLVTVLASSLITRAAARRVEPPAVEGERLAENIFVPVDIADPAVIRVGARLAMAKGGNVLVGAIAAGPGELDDARARARDGELVASAVGAEASSIVRVDTSAAAAIEAIVAEHGVTLVLTGWRRSALAADVVLGGQHAELVAIADVPVLTVLTAGADYRRVVLALDEDDIGGRHAAERDLAVALAGIAAAGARGRAVVIAPSDVAREIAAQVGEDTEAIVDGRSRREAVAAFAREDDLVLVPARSGGSPLHRDALALASLPVGCTVAVPARAHSATALVTGTPTLVGSRAG
jgi:Kef-type K+ transport system membrane component KefB